MTPARRLLDDEVPMSEAFRLLSGEVIVSIFGLAEALATIRKETWSHHVTGSKNDFASWIRYCYGDEVLAQKVENAHTPEDMMIALLESLKPVFAKDTGTAQKDMQSDVSSVPSMVPSEHTNDVQPVHEEVQEIPRYEQVFAEPQPPVEEIQHTAIEVQEQQHAENSAPPEHPHAQSEESPQQSTSPSPTLPRPPLPPQSSSHSPSEPVTSKPGFFQSLRSSLPSFQKKQLLVEELRDDLAHEQDEQADQVERDAKDTEEQSTPASSRATVQTSKDNEIVSLRMALERLHAQMEGMGEYRKMTNERFLRFAEDVGSVRSSLVSLERELKDMTLKMATTVDAVQAVQPQTLHEESVKQSSKLQFLESKIDSSRTMIDRLLEEIKDIRSKLSMFRGVEEILALSKDVKLQLLQVGAIKTQTERHADQIENIFIQVRKQFDRFEAFEKEGKETRALAENITKDFAVMKSSLGGFIAKEDLKHEHDLQMQAIQLSIRTLNDLKKDVAEVQSKVSGVDLTQVSDLQKNVESLRDQLTALATNAKSSVDLSVVDRLKVEFENKLRTQEDQFRRDLDTVKKESHDLIKVFMDEVRHVKQDVHKVSEQTKATHRLEQKKKKEAKDAKNSKGENEKEALQMMLKYLALVREIPAVTGASGPVPGQPWGRRATDVIPAPSPPPAPAPPHHAPVTMDTIKYHELHDIKKAIVDLKDSLKAKQPPQRESAGEGKDKKRGSHGSA